jgi:hypothetical protein
MLRASGVVKLAADVTLPSLYSIVPDSPQRRFDVLRIERNIHVVVVFPFVPVTPTILSRDVGVPQTALQMRA